MIFSGKTIIVTGASSGIGAACVALLKNKGATIIGMDINEPKSNNVDQFIHYNQGDLNSIDEAVKQIPSNIDGLLNVAGVAPSPRFTPSDVLKINFFGLRYFTNQVFSKLSDGASIVNMTSGTGAGWRENVNNIKTFLTLNEIKQVDSFISEYNISNDGLGNNAAYPFSKQLLSVWTMKFSSAEQTKSRGIRVNAVAPAAVATPIMDNFLTSFGKEAASRMQSFGAATPENIALATVFLLSGDAVWVNGTVLPVDGGAVTKGILTKLGL